MVARYAKSAFRSHQLCKAVIAGAQDRGGRQIITKLTLGLAAGYAWRRRALSEVLDGRI